MPRTLREKQRELTVELLRLHDHQQRLAWAVERGRRLPPLPEELKTEAALVPGCLSKLWLVLEFRDGKCWFRCDSDSAVVKGIAGVLCEFYSGHEPAEVISTDAMFLAEAGITQHLSANRRNGLARVRTLMCDFARKQLALNG